MSNKCFILKKMNSCHIMSMYFYVLVWFLGKCLILPVIVEYFIPYLGMIPLIATHYLFFVSWTFFSRTRVFVHISLKFFQKLSGFLPKYSRLCELICCRFDKSVFYIEKRETNSDSCLMKSWKMRYRYSYPDLIPHIFLTVSGIQKYYKRGYSCLSSDWVWLVIYFPAFFLFHYQKVLERKSTHY